MAFLPPYLTKIQDWTRYTQINIGGRLLDGPALKLWCENMLTVDPAHIAALVAGFLLRWIDDSEDYIVQQSSGSTGSPRPIRLPKIVLANSALMTASYFSLGPHSHLLLCLSPDYIAGKMMIMRAMVSGAALHYISPSAHPLAHLPSGQHFALAALTPPQLLPYTHHPALHQFDNLLIGGAPFPETAIPTLPASPPAIYSTYGMTETASHIALRQLNAPDVSPFFTCLPGISVESGPDGCLRILPSHVLSRPLLTTDMAIVHNPHQFSILGRQGNVVNSGGLKLHPELIEQKLQNHLPYPFFLAGIPDPVWGQKLAIFVEKPGWNPQDEQALQKTFAQFIHNSEKPRQVFVVKHFAYTDTGKINRPATLKDLNL